MSKCPLKYIRTEVKDISEVDRLEAIHHSIFEEATKVGDFRNEDGKLMLLKNKYKEGIQFISKINQQYVKVVATLPKVGNFRHKLSVNVIPLKNIGEQIDLFQLESNFPTLSEEALKTITDNLTTRFNISVKIENNPNVKWAGRYNSDGTVSLNKSRLKADTPFHEFAHPFIDLIEKNEQELFDNLVKQIETEKNILEEIKNNKYYKNLSENEQIKEAIVTSIGRFAAFKINPKTGKGLITGIKNLLKSITKYLKALLKVEKVRLPNDFNSILTREELSLGKLKTISPRITLSDLGAFFALGKGKYNLQSREQILFNQSKEYEGKHQNIVQDILQELKKKDVYSKDWNWYEKLVRNTAKKYPDIFNIDKVESAKNQLKDFIEGREGAIEAYGKQAEEEFEVKYNEAVNKLNYVKQLIAYGSNTELLNLVFTNHPNITIGAGSDIYNVFSSDAKPFGDNDSIFIEKYNKWISISKQYKRKEQYGEMVGYDPIDNLDPNWETIIAKYQKLDTDEFRPKLELFAKKNVLSRFENDYIFQLTKESYKQQLEDFAQEDYYNQHQITEDDIVQWGNEEIFKRILFANNIITSNFDLSEQSLFSSLNAYLTETEQLYQQKKKEFDKARLEDFKERKKVLQAILEFKDLQSELGLDVEEFETLPEEDEDIAAPVPKWFIDMYSVSNSGKYFDDIGKGIGGGLAQGVTYLSASQEWDKKLENPQYQTFAEQILNASDLSIFLKDYFYPDFTGSNFSDLKSRFKTKYQVSEDETDQLTEESNVDKIGKELQNIKDNSPLVKIVDRYENLVSRQIKRILDKDNTIIDRLRTLMRDENESIRLVSLQTILQKANNALEDVEGIARRGRAVAIGIEQTNYLLSLMKEDIQDILKDEKTAIENIKPLQTYLTVVKEWSSFLKDARASFEKGNPDFTRAIDKAQGAISDIERYILDNDKSGLIEGLTPILVDAGNKFIKQVDETIDKQNILLKRAKTQEDKDRILEDIKQWAYIRNKMDFANNRELLDVLEGKTADTNALSVWIEPFRDNPNPLVSSFTTFIRNHLNDVDAEVHPILMQYEQEIAPLIKILGGRFNVSSIGNPLVTEDERIDKEGNEYKQLSLLSPTKNAYKEKQRLTNIVKTLQNDLKNSKGKPEEKEIKEFLDQAKDNLLQHQLQHWNLPLKDKFYEKFNFYKDDIGRALKEDVDDIFDQISHIQDIASALNRELLPQETDAIKQLWKDYTLLGNINNLDGTPKEGEEKDKALRMKEIRALNRELFDWLPNQAKFERQRDAYIELLKSKQPSLTKEEYNTQLSKWDDENTITSIKEEWFQRLDEIYSELSDITAKFNNPEISEQLEEIRKDKINILYGHRDEDNQPIGTEIAKKAAERIKEDDEFQRDLQKKLTKLSGLTREQEATLFELIEKSKSGTITLTEKEELTRLMDIYKAEGIAKSTKKRYIDLLSELQELQSRLPTEYYIEVFNNNSQRLSVSLDDKGNIQDTDTPILDSPKLQELLQDEQFQTWFHLNHIETEVFNRGLSKVENKWKRTSQWTKIVPNDPEYYKTTTLKDGTVLKGIPARQYSYRKVKEKFINEPIEGVNVNNKGQWLPKTKEQGGTTYINPEYYRLQDSENDKDQALFKLLQIHTKYHLEGQKGLDNSKKLYLDLYSVRKTSAERNIDNIVDWRNTPKHIKDRAKSWWNSLNEYSSGTGNYGVESKQEKDKANNLFSKTSKESKEDIIRYGTDSNLLPIKYTGQTAPEDITRDLVRNISKGIYSAKTNIKLKEINDFANSLERVVADTEVKQIEKNPETGESNVAKGLRFIIAKEFKGRDKARELGNFGEILARVLTSFGYVSAIPFNYASSIANLIQGIEQDILDAGNGKYTKQQYAKAFLTTYPSFVAAWTRDNIENQLGKQSLEGQMANQWEFLQGHEYESKVGEKFGHTNAKYFLSLPISFHRYLGEFAIQSSIWMAYMDSTKIEQIQEDGSKKTISLKDMYELDSRGIITLKDGIDPEWGLKGSKYKSAKSEVQQINRRLQGAMSKQDASMMSKYTTYNLALFLNRWFITPAINRWAADQVTINEDYSPTKSAALGALGATSGILTTSLLMPLSPILAVRTGVKVGYSVGLKTKSVPRFNVGSESGSQWGWNMSFQNALSKLKENGLHLTRDGFKLNFGIWEALSDEEKRGVWRNLNQLGLVIVLELILQGLNLAGGGDDDEKKKKAIIANLKNLDPYQKLIVYELMRTQVETGQFDDPSQYWNLFNGMAIFTFTKRWTDLLYSAMKDLGLLAIGHDIQKYKKDTGSIKAGTSKTYIKTLKATGLQGLSNSFSDEDLLQFIQNYDANIRSRQ